MKAILVAFAACVVCVAADVPAQAPASLPANLTPLPVLTEKQIRQLVSDVSSQLEMTAGYRRVPPAATANAAPPYPPYVVPVAVLARGDEQVRLGFVMLPRRLPQLWIQGLTGQGSGAVPSEVAVPQVQAAARAVLAETSRIMGRLRLSDLESRSVLLSYVDADAALFVLRAMGYSAITDTEPLPKDDWYKGNEVAGTAPEPDRSAPPNTGAMPAAATPYISYASSPGYPSSTSMGTGTTPGGLKFPAIKNLPTSINFDRLPLIVRVPSTDSRNLGVVGAEQASYPNPYGIGMGPATASSAVPSVAAPLTETIAAGTQELLVLYHPDYPEQFQRVRKALQDSVDRPARQVYIEGLVVEVSRGNLDRLGVQWAAQHGSSSIYLGAAGPLGNSGSAASYYRNDLNNLGNVVLVPPVAGWNIYARIEALVSEDKAQVLSRPSLVTLDNRQATIRVGNDIPVAQATGSNSNIGYSYKSIPTGIMLNVRPRVSEDGQEISMLIDATVSDTVRGQDLRVIDPDTNAVVVSAPTISTRRVQTYARIRDNMPLIIGGLIGRTSVKGHDRVPLLGAIPVIGALFGHTQVETEMREVIIVLTPTVVSEDPRLSKSQHPKDDPLFDVTGTTLFKEKFRIGAEDVVDSAHFRNGERLARYREAANKVIDRDPNLANVAPFSQFAGTRVPADSIFVAGMMYRMLDRLNAGDGIPLQSLRVFEKDATGLPLPVSLAAVLSRHGGGGAEDFAARNPGKALALTFRPSGGSGPDLLSETVPEVRLVDCPTRDAWRRLLWDMNQPDGRGARYTIVLQQKDDLRRLQLAVATHNTVLVNGGERAMSLDYWIAGRFLNVQEVTPNWERILDWNVARDFFIGEHYYAYFTQEHLRAMEVLERVLRARE